MARIVCLLVFPLFLLGDEFIFWAKFSSKNHLITAQNIAISKAMINTQGRFELTCELRPPKYPLQNEIEYLNSHKDALADCFVSSDTKILDVSKIGEFSVNSRTDVIYFPLRFIAKFDKISTKIYAFKEKN